MPKGEAIDGAALRREIEARGWTPDEAAVRFRITLGRLYWLMNHPSRATAKTRMSILRALSENPVLEGPREVLGNGRAEE